VTPETLTEWEATRIVQHEKLALDTAQTLRALLPLARKQARAAKPALLRMIVRFVMRSPSMQRRRKAK
jgi:hypothetical protein